MRQIETIIAIAFCAVAAMIITFSTLSYHNIRLFYESTGRVIRGNEMLVQLEKMHSTCQELQTRLQSPLAAAQSAQVAPVARFGEQLNEQLDVLMQQADDEPASRRELAQLERKIKSLSAELHAVAGSSTASEQPAMNTDSRTSALQDVEAVQEIIASLKRIEGDVLVEQQRDSRRRYTSTVTSRFLRSGSILSTIGILFWAVRWSMRERRHGAAIVAEERERFRVTLTSIGDGVITTDAQGRVTLMNPIAVAMTGWTLAEAENRQAVEVFRVIDEETGSAIEDPVEQVLARKLRITLSPKSLLVSRLSVVYEVEGSAAPIGNPHGDILGVVIVFFIHSRVRPGQRPSHAEPAP